MHPETQFLYWCFVFWLLQSNVDYLFQNMLFRFGNLPKYYELKTKRHKPKILCGRHKMAKYEKRQKQKKRGGLDKSLAEMPLKIKKQLWKSQTPVK